MVKFLKEEELEFVTLKDFIISTDFIHYNNEVKWFHQTYIIPNISSMRVQMLISAYILSMLFFLVVQLHDALHHVSLIKNYRPISLLPICGKILEKLIFNQLYSYLNTNNLITKNQSGFRPGDSTTNQLLYLIDEIHQAF